MDFRQSGLGHVAKLYSIHHKVSQLPRFDAISRYISVSSLSPETPAKPRRAAIEAAPFLDEPFELLGTAVARRSVL